MTNEDEHRDGRSDDPSHDAPAIRRLSAVEAADALRPSITHDEAARISGAEQRRTHFCEDVCRFLGLDPNSTNVQHIDLKLREEGIAPNTGHEYPKYVERETTAGTFRTVVHSKEEHDEFDAKSDEEVFGHMQPVANIDPQMGAVAAQRQAAHDRKAEAAARAEVGRETINDEPVELTAAANRDQGFMDAGGGRLTDREPYQPGAIADDPGAASNDAHKDHTASPVSAAAPVGQSPRRTGFKEKD